MFHRAQHILSRSGVYRPNGQATMATFKHFNGSVLRLTGTPLSNSTMLPCEPSREKPRPAAAGFAAAG